MRILVLNCGSSSVKYQLFETSPETVLAKGIVEPVSSYEGAVAAIIERTVPDRREIEAVGHRVVHGGARFSAPTLLTEEVVREIEAFNELAPLHNPINLAGYRAAQALLPHCPHVAVFDTAFHHTMPPQAYLYAIPEEMHTRHGLRRYGFHGTSHRYVTLRYAELRGGRPEDFKLITCHLGNGCSACAVRHGQSVETSMGFTPLEGLVMGSRPGDIDAGALLHLMRTEKMTVEEANEFLNRQCGLRALSGLTNDMRELLALAGRGEARAELALESFCYRVKKYIGTYYAVLDGADALVFTAGIGENAAEIRARICEGLGALGIALDAAKNDTARGVEADVSAAGARTGVWVIPTHEELLIARETLSVASRARPPAGP
jgi:acetate kinase